MKTYRTPIAAAICCMALASGSVLAQSDTSRSSGPASSSMSRSDMGSSASMDRETVRQVQQALQSKGHNPGPIDGVMGPRTRSALQAYQRANNLTGARGLDQQTMSSLGVQAGGSGSMAGGSTSGSAGSPSGSAGGMAGGSTSGSSAGGSGSSAGGSGTTSGGAGGSMSRPDTGSGTPGGTTGSGTTGSRTAPGSTTGGSSAPSK